MVSMPDFSRSRPATGWPRTRRPWPRFAGTVCRTGRASRRSAKSFALIVWVPTNSPLAFHRFVPGCFSTAATVVSRLAGACGCGSPRTRTCKSTSSRHAVLHPMKLQSPDWSAKRHSKAVWLSIKRATADRFRSRFAATAPSRPHIPECCTVVLLSRRYARPDSVLDTLGEPAMFITYAVIAVLLAAMVLASAATKLARTKDMVEGLHGHLGVPLSWFPFLSACEIAGAAGLIGGLWYKPIGIAAAVGLVLYFIGAVGAHLRKNDVKGAPSATVLLILSAVAIAFRAVTG
ncbi:DoxX family protein [Nocardia sp. NPDC059228]|uniref:DoxX family protein n=1 Tax=Nocardia sp. NPDC059228 TaxID=3346777 RepID=UPI00367AACE0